MRRLDYVCDACGGHEPPNPDGGVPLSWFEVLAVSDHRGGHVCAGCIARLFGWSPSLDGRAS